MTAARATVLGADDRIWHRIDLARMWRIAAHHGGMPPAVLGPAPHDDHGGPPTGDRGREIETDPVLVWLIGTLVRPVLAIEVRSIAPGDAGPEIVRRATAVLGADGAAVGAVRDGPEDRCRLGAIAWPPAAEVQHWLGAQAPADLPGGRWPTAALRAALAAGPADPRPDTDPLLAALRAAERHTEVAVVRAGRIDPAALVVYDSPAGRIVAVPSTAGDGTRWVTAGPGTGARITDGVRRMVAPQPVGPLFSPAGP